VHAPASGTHVGGATHVQLALVALHGFAVLVVSAQL
jgi:hypothetical protein